MPPFIVYTAGRSRTAWLARFLTYRDCRCHFEAVMQCPSIAEAAQLFGPRSGSAETAASPLWRVFDARVPGLRRVVVTRPSDEIIESTVAAVRGRIHVDVDKLRTILAGFSRHLEEISAAEGTLTVRFADLANEDTCAAVFEHCLPYPFDRAWWQSLKDRVVDVDVVSFLCRHPPNLRLLQTAE